MRHTFQNRFGLWGLWPVILLASSTTALAQGRDESLRQLFVASDAVVAVEVRNQPVGVPQHELIVYSPDVKLVQIFKWDVPGEAPAEGKLDVSIVVENEHETADLSSGKQVVLFLEADQLKSAVSLVTVDKWFSVQPFTGGLRRVLNRIVSEQEENPIHVPAAESIDVFHPDPVRDIDQQFRDFVIGLPQLKTILTESRQITRYEWHHNHSHVFGGNREGTLLIRDAPKLRSLGTTRIRYLVTPGGLATLEFADGRKIYLAPK